MATFVRHSPSGARRSIAPSTRAADDEDADVAAAVIDGALHVEDRARLIERAHDPARHFRRR